MRLEVELHLWGKAFKIQCITMQEECSFYADRGERGNLGSTRPPTSIATRIASFTMSLLLRGGTHCAFFGHADPPLMNQTAQGVDQSG